VELHRRAGMVRAGGGVGARERVAQADHGRVGNDEILEARQVLAQLAGRARRSTARASPPPESEPSPR
jgi:hypothetical protein